MLLLPGLGFLTVFFVVPLGFLGYQSLQSGNIDFGYAFTWAGVCLGMVLRSAETAQQAGFIIFLPLTFISSAFVPTQGMPGWLQPIAEWNPMSSLAAACRELFGNPNPAAAVHAWPAQHPELAVICWSAVMLAVFAPLAVHLYRTKAR